MDQHSRSLVLIFAMSAVAACDPEPGIEDFRAQDEPKEKYKDPKKGCEPACTGLDCACDGSPASCDPGLFCKAGACAAPVCGDGVIEGPEDCEDGNLVDGDGCDNDCSYTQILDLAAGSDHTCVLIEGGRVRCWGDNAFGQLGLGHVQDIGDDEPVFAGGDAQIGEPALQLIPSSGGTCALLDGGVARCWGYNGLGAAGYGNTDYRIGDDEPPDWYGNLFLNGRAVQLAGLGGINCALLESEEVRCWGRNMLGTLGVSNDKWLVLGDDEYPAHAAPVDAGAPVRTLGTGSTASHMCVLDDAGELRCWGSGIYGQLGYGNSWIYWTPGGPVSAIAAGLPPETEIVDVAVSGYNTCVAYGSGEVVCWGWGNFGQNGQGSLATINIPSSVPPIDLGGRHVVDVESGSTHSCALTDTGEVICWGANYYGELGTGIPGTVGDTETPGSLGASLDFGGIAVRDIALGAFRTCVLLETNQVYCTGYNAGGELGHGNVQQGSPNVAIADTPPLQIF